ncbi:spore coat protein [Bacillus sp. FJAT-45350]|uniref:spore coat protein n=1 Tax=Bacillus sp. FJAT-45350 TaxID=2011014 RepID=UPI00211B9565|nr:spore coat protein [Bacillus sp. FJAT-45350]
MHHCHKPQMHHSHQPVARPTSQVMPAVVHPTQHQQVQKCCEYIVPEVHPSHTDYITQHHYKHVHSFPQTYSQQQFVTNQQFVQPPTPPRPVPGPGMGPGAAGMGPGMVAGAGMGPGMAPGMAPGMGAPGAWGAAGRSRRFW